jgi:hypothetical protein
MLWISASLPFLRAHFRQLIRPTEPNGESLETPTRSPDKTDRSPLPSLLSVLSVPHSKVFKISS